MTNCTDTLKVFLDTAAAVFAEHGYRHIQTYDIIRRSGRSTASFFSTFTGKGEWGVAVLNARLNQALDQEQEAPKGKLSLAPRAQLTRHLDLLRELSIPLPGIMAALIDERTEARKQYGELIPRYYEEITQAFLDGQEQRHFPREMTAAEMADFTIDSLSMAFAVNVSNARARTRASLILDGFRSPK